MEVRTLTFVFESGSPLSAHNTIIAIWSQVSRPLTHFVLLAFLSLFPSGQRRKPKCLTGLNCLRMLPLVVPCQYQTIIWIIYLTPKTAIPILKRDYFCSTHIPWKKPAQSGLEYGLWHQKTPGFKSQAFRLLAVWPWTNYLTALDFSFIISKNQNNDM